MNESDDKTLSSSLGNNNHPTDVGAVNSKPESMDVCTPATNEVVVQQDDDPKVGSRRPRPTSPGASNATKKPKLESEEIKTSPPQKKERKKHKKQRSSTASSLASDSRFATVVDAALKAGKKFNLVVMERTEEMMQMVHSLVLEMESYSKMEEAKTTKTDSSQDKKDFAAAATMMPIKPEITTTTNIVSDDTTSAARTERTNFLISKLESGLGSIQEALQHLQFASVQTEVELIKEVKLPTLSRNSYASLSSTGNTGNTNTTASGKKGAHSRLYTKFQQAKLEEWYQLSSRPEAAEINSMYKIINSEKYCDRLVQPEGISLKQIRIWFDNRRAKERLDYMRVKIVDIDTKSMDPVSLKTLKQDYLNEAKEVLEARVSRMRENSQGAHMIVEEGKHLVGPNDHIVSHKTSTTASISSKSPLDAKVGTTKKRLRIDYVSSVRKAVKDARDSGASEEVVKSVREKAIEAARERVNIPSVKGGNSGRNMTKEDISHVKIKLLKMLESDTPAEEVADLIELLGTLYIPKSVLLATNIVRQLKLTLKAYKDVKWLVKDVKALTEVFNTVLRSEDTVLDSTTNTSSSTRVKFTPEQLKKLEKCYLVNSQPGKKLVEKICEKLNSEPLRNVNAPPISSKQVRSWYYKRRSSTNNSSGGGAAQEEEMSSETESDDDDATQTPKNEKSNGGGGGGRIFGPLQIEYLKEKYEHSCRPNAKEADEMIRALNSPSYADNDNAVVVTRRQAMTWFSNRRAKERADFVKKKVAEARSAGKSAEEIEKVKEAADAEIKNVMSGAVGDKVSKSDNGTTEEAKDNEAVSSSDSETEDEDIIDDDSTEEKMDEDITTPGNDDDGSIEEEDDSATEED